MAALILSAMGASGYDGVAVRWEALTFGKRY